MKQFRRAVTFFMLLSLAAVVAFPIWFAVTGAFSSQWELEEKLGPVFQNLGGTASWSLLPLAPTLRSLVFIS